MVYAGARTPARPARLQLAGVNLEPQDLALLKAPVRQAALQQRMSSDLSEEEAGGWVQCDKVKPVRIRQINRR